MIKKHIPNTITLGNLFCGCLALISAFEGDLVWAAYFVGISLVLDFFDGFTARMLKVSSAIGKDLDSLADMVTFGVVPGIVMFKMLTNVSDMLVVDEPANVGWTIYPPLAGSADQPSYLPYFGLIITIFSCIRLAKFNNDTRQSDSFIGLPTPANTMIVCSFPLIFESHAEWFSRSAMANPSLIVYAPFILIGISVVLSFLLIAEIPLFALKFKNFSWASNKLVYVFLIVSVIMLISLQFLAIPLIILLYILMSIVNNIFLKTKV